MDLLKFSSEEVLFENYDDELVLLDLPGGVYYTVSRTGADCLLVLLSAHSPGEARLRMVERFDVNQNLLISSVSEMISKLLDFGIVRFREETERGLECAINTQQLVSFEPIVIEQYKDIEDILKFDPIHDVGSGGWPTIRGT